MAQLRVHSDRIEVHLTPAEKTLALRSDDLVVQRDDIRSATITDDPWVWIRGIRRRGTEIPLVVAVTLENAAAGRLGDGLQRVGARLRPWTVTVVGVWYLVVLAAVGLRFYREFALYWFGVAL